MIKPNELYKTTVHNNFEKWMPEICQAVASLEDYHIITIK